MLSTEMNGETFALLAKSTRKDISGCLMRIQETASLNVMRIDRSLIFITVFAESFVPMMSTMTMTILQFVFLVPATFQSIMAKQKTIKAFGQTSLTVPHVGKSMTSLEERTKPSFTAQSVETPLESLMINKHVNTNGAQKLIRTMSLTASYAITTITELLIQQDVGTHALLKNTKYLKRTLTQREHAE